MGTYVSESADNFMMFSELSPTEFIDRLISRLKDEEVKTDVEVNSWTLRF